MYAVATVGLVVYLVLFILSAKEAVKGDEEGDDEAYEKKSGIFLIFEKMALFLYNQSLRYHIGLFQNSVIEKNLIRLHPGRNKDRISKDYYVEKLTKSLFIGFVALVLAVLVSYKTKAEGVLSEGGVIYRGNYLEEEKEVLLRLEEDQFLVTVKPRMLSVKEAEALYQEFLEVLSVHILGENPGLEQISKDMCLCESLEGYPFFVEWESECPDVIGNDGKLISQDDIENISAQKVRLKAFITYEDMEWEEVFVVTVLPHIFTSKEKRHKGIEALLKQSLNDSLTKEQWVLPKDYQGEALVWNEVLPDDSLFIWACGMVVAVAIFFLRDKDLQKEVEERKEIMKADYPEILQKVVLYLGAGMTIRGTFRKLADDYLCEKEKRGKIRPAMEEILYACRELQAGIPEGQVYERLGKRTGVQEYIRFCTLLQQNLKKGNSTLLTRLREEADKAMLEKLQGSRRKSEEAVTKLLVPMVMMLLVVMVMIMIPAFSTTTL